MTFQTKHRQSKPQRGARIPKINFKSCRIRRCCLWIAGCMCTLPTEEENQELSITPAGCTATSQYPKQRRTYGQGGYKYNVRRLFTHLRLSRSVALCSSQDSHSLCALPTFNPLLSTRAIDEPLDYFTYVHILCLLHVHMYVCRRRDDLPSGRKDPPLNRLHIFDDKNNF